MNKKIYFQNKKGIQLCGVLVAPDNKNHPVVILCHGFHSTKDNSTNTRLHSMLKDNNIASFRCDFFGHGESKGKFEDITISEAVDDTINAIKILKEKGYTKIGIIGASFGGITSLITAAKSKDLLFLGLKCPASNFLEIELKHRSKENLQEWKQNGFSFYENEEGERYRLNYNFFNDLKKNNGFVFADKINIPTLIVHGNKDTIVPVEQSKLIHKLIPNCELEIIPNADHRFSKPEHFNKMIELLFNFIVNSVENGINTGKNKSR